MPEQKFKECYRSQKGRRFMGILRGVKQSTMLAVMVPQVRVITLFMSYLTTGTTGCVVILHIAVCLFHGMVSVL